MRFCSRSARKSLDSTAAASTRKGRRGIASLFALAALGLFAGCGGSGNDADDGWFTLVLVPAAGTDPFGDASAAYLYLRIDDESDVLVADEEFPIDGDLTLDHAPTGRQLRFYVEVRDGATPRGVLAEGSSGLHALIKGEHTTITIVLDAPT